MHSACTLDFSTLVSVARALVGKAHYQYLSERCDPPCLVNCALFVHWCYTQCGVLVPTTVQGQLYAGSLIRFKNAPAGSLIFCFGQTWNYEDNDRARGGVGHVGLYTSEGTIVHASSLHGTVVEQTIEQFLRSADHFRGIYKIAE